MVMKNIFLLLILIAPLSIVGQNLDSLYAKIRREQATPLQRRQIDSAFMVEISARKFDTTNHKIFAVQGDSTYIVRELLPLNSYTTTDSLGNTVTVVDMRVTYRSLKKPQFTQYRTARKAQRDREAAELLEKAARIQADNPQPPAPSKIGDVQTLTPKSYNIITARKKRKSK